MILNRPNILEWSFCVCLLVLSHNTRLWSFFAVIWNAVEFSALCFSFLQMKGIDSNWNKCSKCLSALPKQIRGPEQETHRYPSEEKKTNASLPPRMTSLLCSRGPVSLSSVRPARVLLPWWNDLFSLRVDPSLPIWAKQWSVLLTDKHGAALIL